MIKRNSDNAKDLKRQLTVFTVGKTTVSLLSGLLILLVLGTTAWRQLGERKSVVRNQYWSRVVLRQLKEAIDEFEQSNGELPTSVVPLVDAGIPTFDN